MNKISIEDLILLLVLAMYIVAGYFFMKRLDGRVKKIKFKTRVVVYQEEKREQDKNIEFLNQFDASKSYCDTFISCGKDDLKNLLMAFEVRQLNPLCKVYSFCNDERNSKLYVNKGIEIIENLDQFERILEHVKETTQVSI